MNIFEIHENIMTDIREFFRSAIPAQVASEDVEKAIADICPESLIQFKPGYASGDTIESLCAEGILHPDLAAIFSPEMKLHLHQSEALRLGAAGRGFVVTSGTGSGKSLTFLATIVNDILKHPEKKGVRAIIVYPMNALVNSQTKEIEEHKKNWERLKGRFPVRFAQYTGQEQGQAREEIRRDPPHVLLTNYMMLEYILTRASDQDVRTAILKNLKYLVYDELHTYRGRRGSDVAMLNRRIRALAHEKEIICIGTSATMVSDDGGSKRNEIVARVATKFFGTLFEPEQIVSETLSLSFSTSLPDPTPADLTLAVQNPVLPEIGLAELEKNALALWLERSIAIEKRGGMILVRRPPLTRSEIIGELVDASKTSPEESRLAVDALLEALKNLNIATAQHNLESQDRRPFVLPYRLHQFIQLSCDMYKSLHPDPEQGYMTFEPELSWFDQEGQECPLFPVVFSRPSGEPFFCVSLQKGELVPRDFRDLFEPGDSQETDEEDEEAQADLSLRGYLVFGHEPDQVVGVGGGALIAAGDQGWSDESLRAMLPEECFDKRNPRRLSKTYAQCLPTRIFFDATGRCSVEERGDLPYAAWFLRAPLRFDPTAGLVYDGRTSEKTKLASIGNDGRSSGTTNLTLSVLERMREAGVEWDNNKLLSFTDNRQDAALQAGHFNDFLKLVILRHGLYSGLAQESGPVSLERLTTLIASNLEVWSKLWRGPTVDPGTEIPERFYAALRKFISLWLALDLKRGWRVTLPNLEQCALLRIDYDGLKPACADDERWLEVPLCHNLSPAEREELFRVIMDYFRQASAIEGAIFETGRLRETLEEIESHLAEDWQLPPAPDLAPKTMSLEGRSPHSESIGPRSRLGRYLRQKFPLLLDSEDAYRREMTCLLDALVARGFLRWSEARNRQVAGWRLDLTAIRWLAGDGHTPYEDPVRNAGRIHSINSYYQKLYKEGLRFKRAVLARDHTAQVSKEERAQREKDFREGTLNVLYCSPTMELGINIADLTVVHMRNVPPDPANYAQRSGRAGRVGQPAIVFTTCSRFSPHDAWFFRERRAMVSGVVKPPVIDLGNRELHETHLRALALTRAPFRDSATEDIARNALNLIVDYDFEDGRQFPLRETVQTQLSLDSKTCQEIADQHREMLELPGQDELPHWHTETWASNILKSLVTDLDKAMRRWRELMQTTLRQRDEANRRLDRANNRNEQKSARSDRYIAEQRLAQLKNESSARQSLSEFYPFRYLASEGYLPGYNFTRLPLYASLDTGDMIGRPRRIALTEFGPQNLIYHGGKHRKVKKMLPPAGFQPDQDEAGLFAPQTVRLCSACGCFISDPLASICPFDGVSLEQESTPLSDLVAMGDVLAEGRNFITCEEEMRQIHGYLLSTHFEVAPEQQAFERVVVGDPENPYCSFTYIPAADIVRINNQWRIAHRPGFRIGTTSGIWYAQSHTGEARDGQPAGERTTIIKLFVRETADTLYFRPGEALGLDHNGLITFGYALQRAIETCFDIEANEVGCELQECSTDSLLVYENSEGTLGIAAEIMRCPETVLTEIFSLMHQVCRFDDEQDKRRATYADLLSYFNQRDHSIINRFLIKDAIGLLRQAKVNRLKAGLDYEAQFKDLLDRVDPASELERRFLNLLYDRGLALPDEAQPRVADAFCQPDFFYRDERTYIFIDGKVHDTPIVSEGDQLKRGQLEDLGYAWISFRYDADPDAFFATYPNIFRKVKP